MQEIFRKTILISILLISIGVFYVRNRAWVAVHNPLSPYKCDIPVTYAIGTADPRFGVSQEKFAALLQKAEQKWEDALGRDVFRLEADGRVKTNLTYDERQMTTEYLQKIGADIDASKQIADQSVATYETLSAQLEQKRKIFDADTASYERAKKNYEAAVSQYEKELKSYEQDVDYWNNQGGATESAYNKLMKQKKELDQQFKKLQNQEDSLKTLFNNLEKKRQEVNVLVAKINAVAGAVNQIAGKTNEKVANYNQAQAERGEFETGLYTNNNGVESIDIFQFADDKDLLAVLIHEMGHALGLDHAQIESAIMYPKLLNQSADITTDDINLFQTTCVR